MLATTSDAVETVAGATANATGEVVPVVVSNEVVVEDKCKRILLELG